MKVYSSVIYYDVKRVGLFLLKGCVGGGDEQRVMVVGLWFLL